VAAQVSAHHAPQAAFFWLHKRAWGLLLGAFCAVYLIARARPSNRSVNEAMSGLGLGLIVLAVFVFDATMPAPGSTC
jgi:peptidoglycan/LPS O-acetylase OafA/YrhL